MSKKKNSGETAWAEVDKRIRNRRWAWSEAELAELHADLDGLPDLAERVEIVGMDQPALAKRGADREAATGSGAASAPPSGAEGGAREDDGGEG